MKSVGRGKSFDGIGPSTAYRLRVASAVLISATNHHLATPTTNIRKTKTNRPAAGTDDLTPLTLRN
jgi:hypothetical protein